ncbi:hypothetical protein BKA67DRAFT_569192 [Truncatella angustata]|uniref:Rhodopsin domain-containing protein n=1 Tax=Truncatella angustata TaxID=152316 RepID=A0A9P8UJN2_9PEZI|nr:uncharacterized protein BKA67DRAFT_569192 [Truncatella angustata]KAH6653324.1 hypothetical protein BKA67DRAFT_569192 [Truncatella angustata]
MSIPPGTDLCSIPAGPVPDGMTPNFIDPPDLSTATLVVGGVLTALSTTLVVGRLCNAWGHMKLADYLTIFGFILSTSYTGIVMAMHKYSRHAWDLPACWYISDYNWKLLFSQNLLLGLTQFITKAAIFVLYLQLFATGKKTRYAITAGIIFMGMLYLPHPILVAVYMTPHSDETWADLALDGRPQKISLYAPVHGVGSIVLDTYIFIIPILVLRKLHVDRKKKLQLLAVFTVALFGIVSSVASCVWRFIVLFGSSGDFTWQEGQLFIWIMVEHNVALIVGSMPGFAGLIKSKSSTSSLYRTFRSKLPGGSSYGSNVSKPSLPGQYSGSHGKQGDNRRGRAYYYEMDDSVLQPETEVTAEYGYSSAGGHLPEDERGILRTTDLAQSYEGRKSQAK